MLADGLTKAMDGQAILQAIGTGAMKLVDEERNKVPVPALNVLYAPQFFWLTAMGLGAVQHG